MLQPQPTSHAQAALGRNQFSRATEQAEFHANTQFKFRAMGTSLSENDATTAIVDMVPSEQ
eukprot:940320-Amphidinium_carterae.1